MFAPANFSRIGMPLALNVASVCAFSRLVALARWSTMIRIGKPALKRLISSVA